MRDQGFSENFGAGVGGAGVGGAAVVGTGVGAGVLSQPHFEDETT